MSAPLRGACTACAALALIAAPATALAQGGHGSDRANVRRATRAADEAMERGDVEGALQLYQAAFRADPSPRVRRRLADCYEALRRPQEALHHLERLLEESHDLAAPERDETLAHIRRLRANLSTLRVRVTPRDALDLTVTVDGLTIGPDGTTDVGPGTHVVEAAAEGFRPARQQVETAPNRAVDVSLSLSRNEGVAPPVAPALPPSPEPAGLSAAPFFGSLGGTLACAIAWTAAGVSALDARAQYDAAQRALLAQPSADARASRAEALARVERLALFADVAMGVTLAGAALTAALATQTRFARPRLELDATAAQSGFALGLRGRF